MQVRNPTGSPLSSRRLWPAAPQVEGHAGGDAGLLAGPWACGASSPCPRPTYLLRVRRARLRVEKLTGGGGDVSLLPDKFRNSDCAAGRARRCDRSCWSSPCPPPTSTRRPMPGRGAPLGQMLHSVFLETHALQTAPRRTNPGARGRDAEMHSKLPVLCVFAHWARGHSVIVWLAKLGRPAHLLFWGPKLPADALAVAAGSVADE